MPTTQLIESKLQDAEGRRIGSWGWTKMGKREGQRGKEGGSGLGWRCWYAWEFVGKWKEEEEEEEEDL